MHPERAKNLPKMEIGGVLFCLLYALLTRRLYTWSGGELIGVLFGAVNGSPWEQTKVLLLPFLLWGMLELLSLQPSLHRLTAAKTAGLGAVAAVMTVGGSLLQSCGVGTGSPIFAALGVLALCLGAAVSLLLFYSRLDLRAFFMPCVFLLFLFLACYFSLTPFPPHLPFFMDAETGAYGLTPLIPS